LVIFLRRFAAAGILWFKASTQKPTSSAIYAETQVGGSANNFLWFDMPVGPRAA
jgi:hypothetical protein